MRFLFLTIVLSACGFDLDTSESQLRVGSALDGKSMRFADHYVGVRNTLAVDASHIYWAEPYAIMRVSKVGSAPERMTDRLFASADIAADGEHVYVAAHAIDVGPPDRTYERWEGVIARISKATGELEVLAREQAEPFELVLTETHVVWMNSWTEVGANAAIGEATVMRARKDGSGLETIAEHQRAGEGLVVHDGAIFWTKSDEGYVTEGRSLQRFDGEHVATVPSGEDLGIREVRFLDGRITYPDREGRLVQVQEQGTVPLSDERDLEAITLELAGDAAITARQEFVTVATGHIDDDGQQEFETRVMSAELLMHRDGAATTLAEWRPGVINAFLQDLAIDGEHAYVLVDGGVERVALWDPVQ